MQRLDRLDHMAAFLRVPVAELIAAAERDLGVKLFVVFTFRSVMEQDALYQLGREFKRDEGIWVVTDKKKVVTNARAGRSAHNVVTTAGVAASMAVDLIPIAPDGTLQWITPMSIWERLWALAWRCGLDPLGDSIGAHLAGDLGHFEEPAWASKLTGLGLVQPVSTIRL